MMRKLAYWISVYAIAVAIFYFSSLSLPLDGKAGEGLSGWMMHIVEYAVLSIAVYLAFKNASNIKEKRLATFMFVFLYAISDEIHQLFVPGRVGSFFDIGLDAVGSMAVLVFSII